MAKSAGWIFVSLEPKVPAYTFFVSSPFGGLIEYILKERKMKSLVFK